jgi:hypothetical protein
MTERDPHVEALLEKAWRELVRRGPVELAIQLATRDLINEGRRLVRSALADGTGDDEVVATVISTLLNHNPDPDVPPLDRARA